MPRRSRRRRAIYDEDVHRQRGKFTRGLPQSIKIALRRTVFEGDVAALDVAKIVEALTEVIPYRRVIDNANAQNPYAPLLRARRERPSRRAAEKGNELPPPHGALKLRTTLYHILEWEDCASQQNPPLDFRSGSTARISLNEGRDHRRRIGP